MILYFAGGETTYFTQLIIEISRQEGVKPSILHSYYHADLGKSVQFFPKDQINTFLDSGAFSAWTKGISIDVDRYIDFIKINERFLTLYAPLDVIGDGAKTRVAQKYMEARGLSPIPVFHYTTKKDEYRAFVDMIQRYPYVALGGIAGKNPGYNHKKRHLDQCFDLIFKYNPKVRTHGFGVTRQDLLESYPFYSADSTSWLAGTQYGCVFVFDKMKIKDQRRGTIDFDFWNKQRGWKERIAYNIVSFIKLQKHITLLWKNRGIDWESYNGLDRNTSFKIGSS